MLMLGVRPGDYIMIDDKIKIRVVETGAVFRIGIDAPKEMRIMRSCLYEQENPDYQDEEYKKPKPINSITPGMAAKKKHKSDHESNAANP